MSSINLFKQKKNVNTFFAVDQIEQHTYQSKILFRHRGNGGGSNVNSWSMLDFSLYRNEKGPRELRGKKKESVS